MDKISYRSVEDQQNYKIIVLGDPATGKTELLAKFAINYFEEKNPPIVGVNIIKHSVIIENKTIHLMIWDIAGQPQSYMLHRPYFNGADGMILVYDVARSSSFSNVNNWYSTSVKYGLSGIPRVLVGIRTGLESERKIILPMAEHLSKKLNAPYFETSLDKGENINLIFQKVAELIIRNKEEKKIVSGPKEEQSSIPQPAPEPKNFQPQKQEEEEQKRIKEDLVKIFVKVREEGEKDVPFFRVQQAKEYLINNSEVRHGLVFRRPLRPSTGSKQKLVIEGEKEKDRDYDYLFKSIIVGDYNVGKTAIYLRVSKGIFTPDTKVRKGVDFQTKIISIDTKKGLVKVKLQFWDTGGQERFASIRPMFYRNSLGAVLIYDLTEYSSFEHLPKWIKEIRDNTKTTIPIILVGNKGDLHDQEMVSLIDINSFTRNLNLYYMETSAKTGEGVYDCFYILACLMSGLGVPEYLLANRTIYAPGRIPIIDEDKRYNQDSDDVRKI